MQIRKFESRMNVNEWLKYFCLFLQVNEIDRNQHHTLLFLLSQECLRIVRNLMASNQPDITCKQWFVPVKNPFFGSISVFSPKQKPIPKNRHFFGTITNRNRYTDFFSVFFSLYLKIFIVNWFLNDYLKLSKPWITNFESFNTKYRWHSHLPKFITFK